ncbi:hypothetical protein PBI_THONKO_15 [Mycobacterium phage Thonko]|uniref:Uncharacterized protein n=1 Tax=Mycobacterium phage Thonko TaxID=2282910 RepID=A0A346FC62_9CAUD|nr:hypothetical protein I5G57_gp015 [Mycobacterium phage Thonko]AXN53287.1 hypothetical protein PBI_THONKO_15 [Mycobacterium phage Thonko]
MPEGIIATVEGGFATVDIIDPQTRHEKLAELIEIGGPGSVETITRVGPRRQYRVPVGNAQAAGLLDGDEVAAVRTAGHDSGAADALVAADPNVNAGTDAAEWHTPTAEHTSRNAYVGQTSAADERAMAPSPFTGKGTSYGGGNASEVPTHRDVIEHVKQARVDNPVPVGTAGPAERGAVKANLGLAEQTSAIGTDPQARVVDTTEAEPVSATPRGFTASEDGAQGEEAPTEKWTRKDIDQWAAKRGIDTTDAGTKAEALDIIAKAQKG